MKTSSSASPSETSVKLVRRQGRRQGSKKTVKPNKMFYREGGLIHYLNMTSIDHINTFQSLWRNGNKGDAKAYLKANADYTQKIRKGFGLSRSKLYK